MTNYFCLKEPFNFSTSDRWGWLLGFLLIIFIMNACSFKTHYGFHGGEPTDVKALDSVLRLGESTPEEVKTALGEPVGKGRILLPVDSEPRNFWSYYYEKGFLNIKPEGGLSGDSRRLFLYVYFREDRYDGYMWFSSLPEHIP